MTRLWFSLLAVLCAAGLIFSIFWMVRPARAAGSAESASAAPYLLKDHGGRLALFAPGEDAPAQVYEIYTHLLPEGDVEQLRRGIAVASPAELDRLLEDFGA